MQRDGFKCQFCNSATKQLTDHHLVYMPHTKVWKYDNELMITLCNDCHKEIHELNKVIAIIAKNVIKQKIDLVELSEFLETFTFFNK